MKRRFVLWLHFPSIAVGYIAGAFLNPIVSALLHRWGF